MNSPNIKKQRWKIGKNNRQKYKNKEIARYDFQRKIFYYSCNIR